MRYAEALAVLDGLVDFEKQARPRTEFKLDAIRRLLRLAGNPERQVEQVILVAGTKGKGSVCYMLESALRACGRRTGLFVSPHVSSVRERLQLDGHAVDKRVFAQQVERFRPLVRKQPVSYFELTAAMAFDLFARRRVDCAVVEVGLGGRLDATNLALPAVSVITRIGLDHIAVLGGSLTRIAREKAGIMRPGVPVVIGRQPAPAEKELARRAAAVGAEFEPVDRQLRIWDVESAETGVEFSVLGELGAGRIGLPLLGGHQVENAATALVVLGLLARRDPGIRFEDVRAGLEQVTVPARCQVVEHRPLLLVDSCHNPDSGQALARVIAEHLGSRVVLVYGSLRGKLVARTVRPLAPWVEAAVLTAPRSPRAAAPDRLRSIFTRLGVCHVVEPDIDRALAHARRLADGKRPIVVAGSFYLAGEVLDRLGAAVDAD